MLGAPISSSAPDPVFAGKNDFIAKHKLVVFRLTEHWNQRKPDPRAQGLATAMGWTKYKAGDDGLHYDVPPTTLAALASRLKKTLGARGGIRAIGDPATTVRRIGLLPGYTLIQASIAMLPNVDVIVAVTSPSVMAAKQATQTIPIVMPLSSDPVGDGLVKSLARPGGNITGLSLMTPDVGAKRLQLLKEVFPKPVRPVAVLWNPDYVGMAARFRQAQRVGPTIGMDVRSVEVRDSRELERALEALDRERPDALLLLADPLTLSQRLRIVEFAAAERLPAIYEVSQFVEAGGLMSYGPDVDELVRRSATYVDKILKGAKPGDLPIEQPTKFELVINLKTAKALGISIPQSVLLQADRVIQ